MSGAFLNVFVRWTTTGVGVRPTDPAGFLARKYYSTRRTLENKQFSSHVDKKLRRLPRKKSKLVSAGHLPPT